MGRLVITGRGVVSPLGCTVADFLQGLDSNSVAVTPSPWSDEKGESLGWWAPVRGFSTDGWLDPKVVDGTDLFAQYALGATVQALEDAGVAELDPMRTAVVHGTSMGGMASLLRAQHDFDAGGRDAVDRKTMIKIWPNMAAAQIAMRWDLHGPSLTICTACASSLDAMGTAMAIISSGRADLALVGGTEGGLPLPTGVSPFVPATLIGQAAYGMSHGGEKDPRRASLPFDVARSGIVSGEGSAALVLESEDHARARGARILGVLSGYGSVSDSHHPSSPEPTGKWESLAMEQALANAGMNSSDIDALVAHATATPKGDTAEINAINRTFADRPRPLLVTSLKGHLGHTGAASGAMNTIAGLDAFTNGWFPNTAGTREVDPAAQFNVVTGKPVQVEAEHLQVNSFGFGGQDASVVLSRPV